MKKIITNEQKKEIGRLMLPDHADALCAYGAIQFHRGCAWGAFAAGLGLLLASGACTVLNYLQTEN